MKLNIVYKKEKDWFIGHIQEYPDYESQGKTLDELKENLIEIYNFLSKSHISKKNITRLNILKESENTKISEYEALYLKWPRLDHTKNDG